MKKLIKHVSGDHYVIDLSSNNISIELMHDEVEALKSGDLGLDDIELEPIEGEAAQRGTKITITDEEGFKHRYEVVLETGDFPRIEKHFSIFKGRDNSPATFEGVIGGANQSGEELNLAASWQALETLIEEEYARLLGTAPENVLITTVVMDYDIWMDRPSEEQEADLQIAFERAFERYDEWMISR